MRTDDLIAALAGDLQPTPRGWTGRTLAAGTLAGLAGAGLLWLAAFGPRPDLAQAVHAWPFWIKLAYTLALALLAWHLLARAGRPGAPMAGRLALLALPVAALAVPAGLALAAPGADTHRLMMGHSAAFCPFAIIAMALPLLAGSFWSLKRLAPTRLAAAGAAAGLFAGSAGAFVYGFYCTENAAPFILIWYTLGILLTATLGAFLGGALLRWR